jgi:hypothetical protein
MLIAVFTVSLLMIATSSFADQQVDVQAGSQSGFAGDVGSNNVSNNPMNHVIPGGVNYGTPMNYFVKPLPTKGFRPIEEITLYAKYYSESALNNMLAGQHVKSTFQLANKNQWVKPAPMGPHGKRWVLIIVRSIKNGPVQGVDKMVGYNTAWATKPDDNMIGVMAQAGLDAIEAGCNVIQFTAQGAERRVKGSVIGVGAAGASAVTSNNDGDRASGGVFGAGYAEATSKTFDLPWAQGQALIDYEQVVPVADATSVVEK